MRRLPQNISLLAVSVFTVGVVVVAPVSARNGVDDSTQPTSTSVKSETETHSGSGSGSSGSGSGSGSGSSTSGSTSVKVEDNSARHTEIESIAELKTAKGTDSVRDLQERAQKLLASERKDKKVRSVEDRQKSCAAHQADLTRKSDNYSRNAKKHLEVFNSIYTKVLAFQADKQLTVTDFATLKAAADVKQAVATSAVEALSSSAVTIDCNSDDPAAGVATLKASVSNARTALHDYRKAIKDLIVALQAAKPEDNSTNTSTGAEAN
jgi:uncharacterized spore protein YtfJ